jgi:uncharacterized protein YndB with AHSA1/START domain
MKENRVTFQNVSDSALEGSIEIKAAPEKVYAAWTEPEQLLKWFGPPKGNGRLEIDRFDCRVGGGYDVAMVFDDGDRVQLVGTYRELDPPKKLVFTWQWTQAPTLSDETLVTIDLVPTAVGTRLTLTHERFLTIESRNDHHGGWEPLFARLAALLES